MKRYLDCANKFKIKNIIRITSDCPLIDTTVIKNMLNNFIKSKYNYYSNNCILSQKRFADGLDVEIFSSKSLKKAYKIANKKSDYEHVTNIYWKKNNCFRIGFYKPIYNQKDYRFSIDYKSDLTAIKKILKLIKKKKSQITTKNIIFYLNNEKKIKNTLDLNLKKFISNRPDLKV
tara:strand:- start:1830 stop:2354 length:525 start_codon:yes stop_codon:yes gene_type:complete